MFRHSLFTITLLVFFYTKIYSNSINSVEDNAITEETRFAVASALKNHGFELLEIFTSTTSPCIPDGISRFVVQSPFETPKEYITSEKFQLLKPSSIL